MNKIASLVGGFLKSAFTSTFLVSLFDDQHIRMPEFHKQWIKLYLEADFCTICVILAIPDVIAIANYTWKLVSRCSYQ